MRVTKTGHDGTAFRNYILFPQNHLWIKSPRLRTWLVLGLIRLLNQVVISLMGESALRIAALPAQNEHEEEQEEEGFQSSFPAST